MRYYGAYANRLRGRYRQAEPGDVREEETDAAVVSEAERGVDPDDPGWWLASCDGLG